MKLKRALTIMLTFLMAATMLTACRKPKAKLYYVVGESGDWCMIIGYGNEISELMEECAEQPPGNVREIKWIEVDDDGVLEIPEEIDGAVVTEVEGFDFTGSNEVEYVLIPESVGFEVEREHFDTWGNTIFVVEEGSEADKNAEDWGHEKGKDYIIFDDYED